MKKTIGAMAMVLALMATAATDARADHERGGGFGFGFSFGDGKGGFFRFDSGGFGCAPLPRAGHWEYRTERYLISPGGWQQVWVGGGCGGRYEYQYVPPVYGTRTVRVWVNY